MAKATTLRSVDVVTLFSGAFPTATTLVVVGLTGMGTVEESDPPSAPVGMLCGAPAIVVCREVPAGGVEDSRDSGDPGCLWIAVYATLSRDGP